MATRKVHPDSEQVARNHGWQAGYHMALMGDYEWNDSSFKQSAMKLAAEEHKVQLALKKVKKNTPFDLQHHESAYEMAKRKSLLSNQ